MIKTAKQRLSEFLKIAEDQCEADCFVATLSEFKSQEINDLRAAMQSQAQQSQWISVQERLPKARTTVLVVTNFDCIYTCRLPVIVAKNSALDLENERDELKQSLDDLQERFNGIKFIESELRKDNKSQAKRIAELEETLNYYKNMVGA